MEFDNNCGSFATVLGLSNTGEKICSAAGRISTQQGTSIEIFEKSSDAEKNSTLIRKVTRSGHNSVVEHTFFNIAFCNVSAVVEQFMIEFRLASFTVKSRRYVDFSNVGYYIPEFKMPESKKAYTNHIDTLFSSYQKLLELGIPKEDSRFVLPYCYRSNFYCSMNARELLNILRAMLCGRGSKLGEIKKLGEQILSQVAPLCPGIFGDFKSKNHTISDEADFSDFLPEYNEEKSNELVQIIAYTPNAERAIAHSALINSQKLSVSDAERIVSSEQNVREIIRRVLSTSRPRALESAQFTVRYNGISLASITHLVRHRMQGVIIPPLTEVNRALFITPKSVEANADALKIYKNVFSQNLQVYNSLRQSGESEETLIYLVLSGNTLDVISTMNARELLLFFKLRTCSRAQWEIQNYANDMLKKLRKISPQVFMHYGPSCFVEGKCPEGALTCGRFAEIKEKFKI